jgi:O-antigen ligase
MTARPAAAPVARSPATSITIAAVVLAVAFQIQITPAIGGQNVRISVADLISPLLFAWLLWLRLSRQIALPRLVDWRLWPGLAALTIVLAMALAVGRIRFGYWLPWAVGNKFAGWFALVWYFAVGALIANVAGKRSQDWFIKAFLGFAWIMAAVSIAAYALYVTGTDLGYIRRVARAEGLLENPNAFGVLLAVTIAVQAPFMRRGALLGRSAHRIGLALVLTSLVLSGSRTGWLAAAGTLVLLAWIRAVDWRGLAVAAGSAALALVVLLYVLPISADLPAAKTGYQSAVGGYVLNNPLVTGGTDVGIDYRIETTRRALDLWSAHPILGIGLGGFAADLIAQGRPAEYLHSTYVWILSEMGVIGFILFGGFFLLLWRMLLRGSVAADAEPMRLAAIGTLAAFTAAALGMEALYQRHIWFVLGLALAVLPKSPAEASAEHPG